MRQDQSHQPRADQDLSPLLWRQRLGSHRILQQSSPTNRGQYKPHSHEDSGWTVSVDVRTPRKKRQGETSTCSCVGPSGSIGERRILRFERRMGENDTTISIAPSMHDQKRTTPLYHMSSQPETRYNSHQCLLPVRYYQIQLERRRNTGWHRRCSKIKTTFAN